MNSYEHMNTFMAPDQACMEHNHSSRPVLSIQLGGPCAASFAAIASIAVAKCEQRNWKLKLAVLFRKLKTIYQLPFVMSSTVSSLPLGLFTEVLHR